jgi:hypothetical protein
MTGMMLMTKLTTKISLDRAEMMKPNKSFQSQFQENKVISTSVLNPTIVRWFHQNAEAALLCCLSSYIKTIEDWITITTMIKCTGQFCLKNLNTQQATHSL